MGQRRDRTEHPSRSWRPYRRPDDVTGQMTGRRDSPTGDDGTSNMFSHTRDDGADLYVVTEPDYCVHCSIISGD